MQKIQCSKNSSKQKYLQNTVGNIKITKNKQNVRHPRNTTEADTQGKCPKRVSNEENVAEVTQCQ